MTETTGYLKDEDTRATPKKAGTVRNCPYQWFEFFYATQTTQRHPTPLSAALTAAVKSRWKNGVSVDTSGAFPMGGKLISELDLMTPDSRLLSTPNRSNANESLAYGTTEAISC